MKMRRLPIRVLALSFIAEFCILGSHPIVRPASADPPQGTGYVLVWSDDFNGTELDQSHWNVKGPGPRGGGELIPTAVSVDGMSNLVITTYTANGTHYSGLI